MATDEYASPAVAHVVESMTVGQGLSEDHMYLVHRVAYAAAHAGYSDGWLASMARDRSVRNAIREAAQKAKSSEAGQA